MVKPQCIKPRLYGEEWDQGKQDIKQGGRKYVYWNDVRVPAESCHGDQMTQRMANGKTVIL